MTVKETLDHPGPDTAVADTAEPVDSKEIPATDHDALVVILEALDIPYAACVGDDEIRAKILDERLGHTLVMLRDWLDPDHPGYADDHHRAWSLGYLREKLARHPATGYRTDYAEVMADWAVKHPPAGGAGDPDATGPPAIGATRAARGLPEQSGGESQRSRLALAGPARWADES